jgi:hypothetical protein
MVLAAAFVAGEGGQEDGLDDSGRGDEQGAKLSTFDAGHFSQFAKDGPEVLAPGAQPGPR